MISSDSNRICCLSYTMNMVESVMCFLIEFCGIGMENLTAVVNLSKEVTSTLKERTMFFRPQYSSFLYTEINIRQKYTSKSHINLGVDILGHSN